MDQRIIVLITVLIFAGFAISGKLKIHVAAMLIPAILEISGVLTFEETWAGLVNPSVIMMAAMFVVAAGLNKTDIIVRISRKILKPESSDFAIMLSLLVPSILLCNVVNGTAAVTIMLPIIRQICAEYKRPMSKFMMGYMFLVGIWLGYLPIGSGAAGYLSSNAIIEKLGGTGGFTIFTNMIAKTPTVIVGTIACLFFATKIAPDCGNIPVIGAASTEQGSNKKVATLDEKHSNITIGIFLLTVIGVIVAALMHISTWWPAIIGALAMVLTGVLTDREALQAIANPIIFIFVGTLPLATAINKTGCNTVISDAFNAVTAGWPPIMILLALYLICMICTQFLQNSAVSSIFRLLAPVIAIGGGYNPVPMMLAASMGALNGYLLPTATAAGTICFVESGMTTKQWFKNGVFYTVLQIVLFILWVPFIFPLK